MEKARIFLVEDNQGCRDSLVGLLEDIGYSVVLWAENLGQALDAIQSGRLRELGVNVAIVDGNLSPGDISCSDGFAAAGKIREAGLPIKIIALSGTDAKKASYGDKFVKKGVGIEELIAAIDAP
jgi:CheY-like chemotaxis protein